MDHCHISVEWVDGNALVAIRLLPEPDFVEEYILPDWHAYRCKVPDIVRVSYMFRGVGYAVMVLLECIADKLPNDLRRVVLDDIDAELRAANLA